MNWTGIFPKWGEVARKKFANVRDKVYSHPVIVAASEKLSSLCNLRRSQFSKTSDLCMGVQHNRLVISWQLTPLRGPRDGYATDA